MSRRPSSISSNFLLAWIKLLQYSSISPFPSNSTCLQAINWLWKICFLQVHRKGKNRLSFLHSASSASLWGKATLFVFQSNRRAISASALVYSCSQQTFPARDLATGKIQAKCIFNDRVHNFSFHYDIYKLKMFIKVNRKSFSVEVG